MIFTKKSNYHAESSCGRYTICRSNNVAGGAYTATRNGKPDVILSVVRFDDEADRTRAYREAVAVCEGDSRV